MRATSSFNSGFRILGDLSPIPGELIDCVVGSICVSEPTLRLPLVEMAVPVPARPSMVVMLRPFLTEPSFDVR